MLHVRRVVVHNKSQENSYDVESGWMNDRSKGGLMVLHVGK